jgi:hypothetical protein
MILEKQTEALVQQEGTSQDSIAMSLDLDSAQILMQMLSKNLYSDSVGSTVRECASNALDSHRRAGVDKPIIVSFGRNDSNNYEFSVEDFGTGLDAEDVKNIISKYGKSTKRNSATELGMMGLGFKAPLAYSSSFYFVCRKDGMERKYMMYEGEDTNTIDLLYEKPTTEPNGVKVIVPVTYYDRSEFQNKIRQQLAYFESVYFNIDGFDNDFQIVRSEHFQWSPLASDSRLHICLDNVYYPIEFEKLGISRIDFPVALRFSLTDGIFPTPNRESLRYTKEAKEIILNKIRTVADYFVNKYNESVVETDNIHHIMEYFSNDYKYINIFGNSRLEISELCKHATISYTMPTLKGIQHLNLKVLYKHREYILGEYETRYYIQGRFRECKRYYDKTIKYFDRNNSKDRKYYILNEKISGKMKEYLKSIHPNTGYGREVYILKKKAERTLGTTRKFDADTYISLLALVNHPKHMWRTLIQEFQKVLEMCTSTMQVIEDVVIPDTWMDPRKKQSVKITSSSTPGVRRVKLAGEITGKKLESLERYVDGKNSKLVSTIYKLENIHRNNGLIVYGSQENYPVMDKLFKMFNRKTVNFIVFSDRELKNLEKIQLHNWIKFDEFMKQDNKPFRRMVTAHLIEELIDNYKSAFSHREDIADVSESLSNDLITLKSYANEHHVYGDDELYKAVVAVAEEHNLFDMEMFVVYKRTKATLEKLSFINVLCEKMSSWGNNADLKKVMCDMFKYYRTRINWTNYNIKLTEEKPLEEVLTEETVETLLED